MSCGLEVEKRKLIFWEIEFATISSNWAKSTAVAFLNF